MLVGIPKEIKDHEYRVGATPAMINIFTQMGHQVLVQKGAGERIGFTDEYYEVEGAKIVESAKEVYQAQMIIKVKEPMKEEYPLLQEGQIIFGYFHLAPDPAQARALVKAKSIAIAYETVTDDFGRLPLLIPMSEIAGRIAIQAGATALQMSNGGRGVLLGGVPGVLPGRVAVIGGGIVGTQAAKMAMGLGADVTILDNNVARLRELDLIFGSRLKTLCSNGPNLRSAMIDADLAIGAVLLPGKVAPKLVSADLIKEMKRGSVVVDVAIDQGGCIETARPTTHSKPMYIKHGVVHYCVTNMPGGCAFTATQALTNVTMPYALRIATLGVKRALLEDPHLMAGLNVCLGKVTYLPVAQDLNYQYHPAEEVLTSMPVG